MAMNKRTKVIFAMGESVTKAIQKFVCNLWALGEL